MASRTKKTPMNFKTMAQADVPQGRSGKHKPIVTKILSDLDQLGSAAALKVPLAQLTESKEKVRSALNRATRKNGRSVATASDDTFLYVWKGSPPPRTKASE
jgi:DNA helicase TIP49 (TBP-interacting protein)